MSEPRRVVILGAAGRDFHNFNTYYRDNADFKVVASTGNLPNEVIAASSDFPSPRINDVIGTFGRMGKTEEGKKLLKDAFRCNGWGVAVEGDFAPVLDIMRAKDVKVVAPAGNEPKKSK